MEYYYTDLNGQTKGPAPWISFARWQLRAR